MTKSTPFTIVYSDQRIVKELGFKNQVKRSVAKSNQNKVP